MAPGQSQNDRAAGRVVRLLHRGGWAAIPIGTIESRVAGGRVVDFPPGGTVYTELALIMVGSFLYWRAAVATARAAGHGTSTSLHLSHASGAA